jgi:hypothetical protein
MAAELLIRLAGADPHRFDTIEHERSRYASLGAAMLVPPLIGGASIFVAARYLGNGVLPALAFALLWGVVILAVDRVLVVTTLRRVPGERIRLANILAILFRFLLAALVGLAIGLFAKLALSADTAKQELADEVRTKVAPLEAPLVADLARVDASIRSSLAQSDAQLSEARGHLTAAIAARTAEAQGVGGSLRYGDQGPGYRAADAEVRERQAQIRELEAQRNQQQTALRNERTRVERQIERVRTEVDTNSSRDLFAQIHALYRLLVRHPYLWWFTGFFAAFLLLLELIPVIAKSIIVRDSAYAFRERMKSWAEEERLRVELEALREAHVRRVTLRTEFITGEAEADVVDQWETLASRSSSARLARPAFSFRPAPPENATRALEATNPGA